MNLKTTTWKGRNIHNLQRTLDFAVKKKMVHPVIIDIGPGGSVAFMTAFLPLGKKAEISFYQLCIRKVESLMRKSGLFRLNTMEPLEIAGIFSPLQPGQLMVFDREKKVLNAVRDLVDNGQFNVPVKTARIDIQKQSPGVEADIVIALNILSRTTKKEMALKNLVAATKLHGLICINIDESPPGFRKLGRSVFERIK
ncbi:MAG: hypothetical protein K9J30_06870 [Bacteroidales bacterium]|nr:hypothetical protein [Bacteroidales bacterium]